MPSDPQASSSQWEGHEEDTGHIAVAYPTEDVEFTFSPVAFGTHVLALRHGKILALPPVYAIIPGDSTLYTHMVAGVDGRYYLATESESGAEALGIGREGEVLGWAALHAAISDTNVPYVYS